jgi:hypothetical protein
LFDEENGNITMELSSASGYDEILYKKATLSPRTQKVKKKKGKI